MSEFDKCIKVLFKGLTPNRIDLMEMIFNYREKEIKNIKIKYDYVCKNYLSESAIAEAECLVDEE